MDDDLVHILSSEANALGISLDQRQKQLFALYYDEFQLWNEKINLTSLAGGASFVIKHFVDSLLPLAMIPQETKKIMDLGTGGGLPGIPLKIARPDLEVVLLDSSRKKTSFLKQVITRLGLSGIQAVTGRADDLCRDKSWRETCDMVISRAAFKLGFFIETGSPFLAVNGLLLAMKGHDLALAEQEEGWHAAQKCGMKHMETFKTTLPCCFEEASASSSLWGVKGQRNPDNFPPDIVTSLIPPAAITDNEGRKCARENGRSIIVYKKIHCFP
jgi:16S rRNA (guanine527-N7)-methyltransferase